MVVFKHILFYIMRSSKSLKRLPPLNCDGSKTSNMIKSTKILERVLEDSRKAQRVRRHSVDAKALATLSCKTSSMSLSSLKSTDGKSSKLAARLQTSPLVKRHSKADKRDSATTLATKSSSSSTSSLSKSSMIKSTSTSFLKKDDLNPRGRLQSLSCPSFHVDSHHSLFRAIFGGCSCFCSPPRRSAKASLVRVFGQTLRDFVVEFLDETFIV